jgi:hypothetical protein
MNRKSRVPLNRIYFLRAGLTGPVKIGCCGDIKTRIVFLQQGNHRPLMLLREIPGSPQKECWLHKYFHEQHLRGEWFTFHPDMMTVEPEDDHSTLKGENAKVQTFRKQGLPLNGERWTVKYGRVAPKLYDPDCPEANT